MTLSIQSPIFKVVFYSLLILSTTILSCSNKKISGSVISVKQFGAKGNGIKNDTKAFQEAIYAAHHQELFIPEGIYLITHTLKLPSSIKIRGVGEKSQLVFSNVGSAGFSSKFGDQILIENIGLIGPGIWSEKWTNSGSRRERGIEFTGIKNLKIRNCFIENFGLGGIYLEGGKNIEILNNTIIGTHIKGSKLHYLDNYQFGIIIVVSSQNYILDNITLKGNNISFTNQGILTSQGVAGESAKITLDSNVIHHIIGQHGMYLSTSNTKIINNVVSDCGLEGIKIQSANISLENITIKNNIVKNCLNSQAFNITEIHEGKNEISNVLIENNSAINCARGINLSGKIKGIDVMDFTINGTSKEMGLNIQTYKLTDAKFENIKIINPARNAIYVNSQISSGIIFKDIEIKCKQNQDKYAPIKIYKGDNIQFENVEIENSNFDMPILYKSDSIDIKNLKMNGKYIKN